MWACGNDTGDEPPQTALPREAAPGGMSWGGGSYSADEVVAQEDIGDAVLVHRAQRAQRAPHAGEQQLHDCEPLLHLTEAESAQQRRRRLRSLLKLNKTLALAVWRGLERGWRRMARFLCLAPEAANLLRARELSPAGALAFSRRSLRVLLATASTRRILRRRSGGRLGAAPRRPLAALLQAAAGAVGVSRSFKPGLAPPSSLCDRVSQRLVLLQCRASGLGSRVAS